MQAAAAYVAARAACNSMAQAITYIDYAPEREGKGQWLCSVKALWAAEQALGPQAEPLQKAFAAKLAAASSPVRIFVLGC